MSNKCVEKCQGIQIGSMLYNVISLVLVFINSLMIEIIEFLFIFLMLFLTYVMKMGGIRLYKFLVTLLTGLYI